MHVIRGRFLPATYFLQVRGAVFHQTVKLLSNIAQYEHTERFAPMMRLFAITGFPDPLRSGIDYAWFSGKATVLTMLFSSVSICRNARRLLAPSLAARCP